MSDINARFLSSYYEAAEEQPGETRVGRAKDLVAAASGYGSYCPEGVPVELALCLLLIGFAIAFYILYTAVTMAGRRRRRDLDVHVDKVSDIVWMGRFFTPLSYIVNVFDSKTNTSNLLLTYAISQTG